MLTTWLAYALGGLYLPRAVHAQLLFPCSPFRDGSTKPWCVHLSGHIPGLSLTAPQQAHTTPPCAALCSPGLCEAPNLEPNSIGCCKTQVSIALLDPLYFQSSSYYILLAQFGPKTEVLTRVVIFKPWSPADSPSQLTLQLPPNLPFPHSPEQGKAAGV